MSDEERLLVTPLATGIVGDWSKMLEFDERSVEPDMLNLVDREIVTAVVPVNAPRMDEVEAVTTVEVVPDTKLRRTAAWTFPAGKALSNCAL